MAKNKRNGANRSVHDGLTTGQRFRVKKMIGRQVRKSESRILAEIKELRSEITDIKVDLAKDLRTQTWAVFGLVATVVIGQISLLVWMVNRIVGLSG